MLKYQYYSIINILGTLNFRQSQSDYSKFSLPCTGKIKVNIDNDQDKVININTAIDVTIRDSVIRIKYKRYSVLPNGDLVLIPCEHVIRADGDELLNEIASVLKLIYTSPEYEFILSDTQYSFNPRTLFHINMESIKESTTKT